MMTEPPGSFFDVFCNDFPNSVLGEGDKLPFDVGRSLLTEEELEGECLDWCIQFLNARGCSSMLTMVLARKVVFSAMEVARQKMGELLIQSAPFSNESLNESPDPDSSASSGPGFVSNEIFGQLVFNKLLQVCHSWDPSMTPTDEEAMPAEVSVHAIKNSRRKMEDKHVVLPMFGKLLQDLDALSFYAVYDGHGGIEAAKYASVQLHSVLCRKLQSQLPKDALHTAFLETDRMFVDRAKRFFLYKFLVPNRSQLYSVQHQTSGSTAVCVLVEKDQLHVAWLGDSQALLVRDGKPIKLVTPHKPEDEEEKKRIEDLGGCVVFIGAWRVNGTLSVSRAIGDAFHKPCISGEPAVETFQYKTGDWLVLACDGLWDQLTYDDVAKMLNDDNDGDTSTLAQRLVRAARDGGSSDNITAVVVHLTIPPNVGRQNMTAPSNPNRTAEMNADGKNGDDKMGPRTDTGTKSARSGESPVGQDTTGSSVENSHLAVSMKRLADTELEVSDDEKLADVGHISVVDEELGVFVDSGSSVDVQRSSSQGSCQNFLRLSKVGSLEDALMAVAAEFTSEFSPSSSGLSDVMRTTSEDTSGQSPDPSIEAGAVEMCVASMHKRTKRRSLASWQRRQKENRRPSDDADQPGETPPCLRAGSPLLCEEDLRRAASSFGESCCQSLSLPSGSGTLLHAHLSSGTQRVAPTTRPIAESRGGRISSINAPSRWTIAVEVDAEVGMFEENSGNIVSGPPISAMNLSSHW